MNSEVFGWIWELCNEAMLVKNEQVSRQVKKCSKSEEKEVRKVSSTSPESCQQDQTPMRVPSPPKGKAKVPCQAGPYGHELEEEGGKGLRRPGGLL